MNYIISTPDHRWQRRLCHINILKEYYESEDTQLRHKAVTTVKSVGKSQAPSLSGRRGEDISQCEPRFKNSDVLENLEDKFHHLSPDEREDMIQLVNDFIQVFSDVPSTTNVVCHDVEVVGDSTPCKQHPYRVNPLKLQAIQKEIDYMLEKGIIEYSCSDWSSPCILVPKADGSFQLCTDFRKLNAITKTDSYPLPRIDDRIDRVGYSRYVSKLDLSKGYWQVPLTEKAKQVSAFVAPNGLYQYRVMPFDMKNATATFQRLINFLTSDLEGCEGYINDIVVYSDTWKQHVQRLRALPERLAQAQLTVNLLKNDFGHAQVVFLGHVIGQGCVTQLATIPCHLARENFCVSLAWQVITTNSVGTSPLS